MKELKNVWLQGRWGLKGKVSVTFFFTIAKELFRLPESASGREFSGRLFSLFDPEGHGGIDSKVLNPLSIAKIFYF